MSEIDEKRIVALEKSVLALTAAHSDVVSRVAELNAASAATAILLEVSGVFLRQLSPDLQEFVANWVRERRDGCGNEKLAAELERQAKSMGIDITEPPQT